VSSARVAAARLRNQRLAAPGPRDPASLVAWFGAVQAQELGAAKWALALRMGGEPSDAIIARALDEGRLLRTHVLRPTWHFVSAADIRWMLDLTAPRVHRMLAWGHRQLGLDLPSRRRAARIIERVLTREGVLTRTELADRLARARLPLRGVRLALVTIHAELEGVICSGPRRGKDGTYALLDARAPRARTLPRDEALAELTGRYLRSHGPATVRDFAWWSGLAVADVRRGLDIVRARGETIDGIVYWSATRSRRSDPPAGVHLLPIYDEYFVAYRDLSAVPRDSARWGILPQAVVSKGQVAGAWKARLDGDRVVVEVRSSRRLTGAERHALARAAERYGRFLEMPASVRLSSG
jgi:winged helix DNA-binding protein